MSHIRIHRPSPAMAVALVALFVALSGTSIAAVELTRNSVGSGQVKNESLKSGDIAKGAVRSSDIRNGTVTHRDVRNGTLRGADIATNTVDARNLADSGVTSADLARDSVTGHAIRNGSITGDDLADGTIPQLQKLTEDGPADVPSLRTLGPGPRQAAAGDDPRLSDARAPTGGAGGALTGTFPNPSLADGSIDATDLFSAALKDGAAGTPTLRSLGTGGDQAAAGNDARLSDERTPVNGSVGTAKFATLPHARVLSTAAQTISNVTTTTIDLDTVSFSSGVTFNAAANVLTATQPGTYLVTGEVGWAGNASGARVLQLMQGATELSGDVRPAAPTFETAQVVTQLVELNAGDSIRLQVQQSSGGDLATSVFTGRSASLAMQWLGPRS